MPHAVQGALNWLEETQDKSLEELQAAQAAAAEDEDEDGEGKPNIDPLEDGAGAKSLVCNDCGKKFRNADQASFHADKRSVLPTLSLPDHAADSHAADTRTSPSRQMRLLR